MSTCPATSALGHGHWGTSSQHRVYAALREFCNFEVRKTRRLGFNPVWTVELEAEITPEAQRLLSEFLAAAAARDKRSRIE